MKLITKKGIESFCKLYNAKVGQGNNLTPYLQFVFLDAEGLNKVIWKCRDKDTTYYANNGSITFEQKELSKIVPADWCTEERVWFTKNKIYLTSKMEHSHLSNTFHYLEILLTLGKINKKDSENYIQSLQESIVPELEERFKGEILEYVPYYDYEKDMYKEYLKVKKSQKA